jgi:molybdopterin-guanine dinucleotide biosynthesis protein A
MGGQDKSGLVLGGRTLLARVIERLDPQVEALAISANGDLARHAETGLTILPDTRSQGPLSGVLAALEWAAVHGADFLATAPVDSPFVPCDLVPRLLLAAESSPNGAAVAESAGRLHPVFALWPVSSRLILQRRLERDEAKVMGFATALDASVAVFPDADAFLNINTPDDLLRAETLLAAAG